MLQYKNKEMLNALLLVFDSLLAILNIKSEWKYVCAAVNIYGKLINVEYSNFMQKYVICQ